VSGPDGQAPPPIRAVRGIPCDCYNLNGRRAGHSGGCVCHVDRWVQVTRDGAPCLLGMSARGMAADVASAAGVASTDVRTVSVREDYDRGGAWVTVQIFAPYSSAVTR
jgi:hypothetical protein